MSVASSPIHVSELTDKEAEARFIDWYEQVCDERLQLLREEEGYKRRIEELETERTDIVTAFEELMTENNKLRAKYEPTDSAYTESYETIHADRQSLLEANKSFKKRIRHLEVESEKCSRSFNLYKTHERFVSEKETPSCPHCQQKNYLEITGHKKQDVLRNENRDLRVKLWKTEEEYRVQETRIKALTSQLKELSFKDKQKTPRGWAVYLKNARKSDLPRGLGLGNGSKLTSGNEHKPLRTAKSLNDISSSVKSPSMKLPAIRSDCSSSGLVYGLSYSKIHKNRYSLRPSQGSSRRGAFSDST